MLLPDDGRCPSLAVRAARKGVLFGASENAINLAKDPALRAAFQRECGLLVSADDLKWWPVRREPNRFDFAGGDWIARFATDSGLLFRGHTLIWHYGLPGWVKDVPAGAPARKLLVEHIWALAGRYRGRMHSWDVVNEALEPGDGRADGLRRSYWLEALGPDYIELAFRTAAEADPKAFLVYNDYGLSEGSRDDDRRRRALLKLLERLKSRDVPIHAVGLQSHLPDRTGWFDDRRLMSFFDEIQALGMRTMITELDVRDDRLPRATRTRDALVSAIMDEYLPTALSHPALAAVITWGLSDKYTYINEFHPRADGFPARPLPLDRAMNRKPAWQSLAKAFDDAPVRPAMT